MPLSKRPTYYDGDDYGQYQRQHALEGKERLKLGSINENKGQTPCRALKRHYAVMQLAIWSGTKMLFSCQYGLTNGYLRSPAAVSESIGRNDLADVKASSSRVRVGSKGRRMDTEKLRRDHSTVLKATDFVTSSSETLEMVPDLNEKPAVYVITPTHDRLFRKVDMVRMAQALMLDGGVYWIVIEDSKEPPDLGLRKFLYETGLPFAHLAVQREVSNGHRGLAQRNAGIDIVHQIRLPGVVYFADDDNAYDHRLFDQLRTIERVGLFSTGFSGWSNFEACILDETTGDITSFATNFNWVGDNNKNRTFHVDMGGFAINVKLLFAKPDWRISYHIKHGFMESYMVGSFIETPSKGEPIGGCTEIYFWHMPKIYDVDHLDKLPHALPPPDTYGKIGSVFQVP